MDFLPGPLTELGFPPGLQNSFIIALSGTPTATPGESERGAKSVIALPVDLEKGRVSGTPQTLLKYTGDARQMPVGVSLGPDGLYVVPIFPDSDGNSVVLRMSYNSSDPHTKIIDALKPESLIKQHACYACHVIDGEGYGHVAPVINRNEFGRTLNQKLKSKEYAAQLDAVDLLQGEPFQSFAPVRAQLRVTDGIEQQRIWVYNRLMEPRFDQQVIAMPNPGLTAEEAQILTDWLLEYSESNSWKYQMELFLKWLLPFPTYQSLMASMLFSLLGGALLTWLILFNRSKRS